MQVLIDWLGEVLDWLLGIPECIYSQMVDTVTGWLGDVLEPTITGLIPVGFLSYIHPHFAWGLEFLAFDYGLMAVVMGTVIRFAIRRLPFVG